MLSAFACLDCSTQTPSEIESGEGKASKQPVYNIMP